MFDLEVGVHGQSASRYSPQMMLYVLACVTKQVKVRKEGIINNLVPLKGLARGSECFGSCVVSF